MKYRFCAGLVAAVSLATSVASAQQVQQANSFRPFMEKFVPALKADLEARGSKNLQVVLGSAEVVRSDSPTAPYEGLATLVAAYSTVSDQVQGDIRIRLELRFSPGIDRWSFVGGRMIYERYVVVVPAFRTRDDRTGEVTTLGATWADRVYRVMYPPPETVPFDELPAVLALKPKIESLKAELGMAERKAVGDFHDSESGRELTRQVEEADKARQEARGQERLDASSKWMGLRDKLRQAEADAITGSPAVQRARESLQSADAELVALRERELKSPTTRPARSKGAQ